MKKALHFWIGHFKSSKLFSDYFEEDDEADAETVPLNKFVIDQGQLWVDHDHLEICITKESPDIKDVFNDGSYVESYKMKVYEAFSKCKGINKVNCYVALYDADSVDEPKSVKGKGYWLQYLGTFNYKEK